MSRHEFSFSVPASHPSLPGHFPGHPVVPGVLLLDHVLHALEQSTGRTLARLQQVRFVCALLPDEIALGSWELAEPVAKFRLWVVRAGAEVRVAEGSGSLAAQGLR